jgi:ACR3 family arsenite efflux pump ArsB
MAQRLGFFERYLTLWVASCMLAGIALGKLVPSVVQALRGLEFGQGSQINAPIAILIWLMITPMMMKVDFTAIRNVGRKPAGLVVTLIVNWLVKPFSMAFLAWLFFRVLLYSVIVFIVIPLAAGTLLRRWWIGRCGKDWFERTLLPRFAPVTITALLATLVFIFAFQADNITNRFFHVVLIAVPITLQVYFNASLVYGLMKLLKVEHSVAAPGALIGASNFFELAVATAIALFGPQSGAALATVVGVLVEVPVMLSVCAACNRTRHWFLPCQNEKC